ncbi:hypothetical protein BGZ99_007099 [Dissophora globulifera]|uniref:Uncharacterized protein n=1 Tax=Dissophora globulifera TaxID=979702 RepID=A0A9P6RUH9_9FUNG|nr:hypothetical protein BGZ99_007099 [Dissophora globulifera]
MTVGLMLTGKQGEEMLQTEKVDLIAVERSFLRHPNCVGNTVRDLNVKIFGKSLVQESGFGDLDG